MAAISASSPVQSYRERLPVPQLAGRVSSVWMQQVAAEGSAYEHRTFPNGCVELSWAVGTGVVAVTGPQRRPILGRLAPGSAVVGIRFRPGVAPSILGLPASELVDLRVEVDRLWGRGESSLAERLAEADSPDTAARLLENEVIQRFADAGEPDPLVTAAIRRLQPWRPDDIGTWTSGLFISPRQLRRRCGPSHDHDASYAGLRRALLAARTGGMAGM